MPTKINVDIFTTGYIAKMIGVAPRTVSKWFDSGRLKGYRIPGSNDRRIPRAHLAEFLAANDMAGCSDEAAVLAAEHTATKEGKDAVKDTH